MDHNQKLDLLWDSSALMSPKQKLYSETPEYDKVIEKHGDPFPSRQYVDTEYEIHALDTDGLENYWCSNEDCDFHYTHVGPESKIMEEFNKYHEIIDYPVEDAKPKGKKKNKDHDYDLDNKIKIESDDYPMIGDFD